MRKLGIQSVAFSVGMMTILSAIVWFVPTDPSLPLSVVAAPSVNDGSAAVLGCGNLASYGTPRSECRAVGSERGVGLVGPRPPTRGVGSEGGVGSDPRHCMGRNGPEGYHGSV